MNALFSIGHIFQFFFLGTAVLVALFWIGQIFHLVYLSCRAVLRALIWPMRRGSHEHRLFRPARSVLRPAP